jgi:hypothetical protein
MLHDPCGDNMYPQHLVSEHPNFLYLLSFYHQVEGDSCNICISMEEDNGNMSYDVLMSQMAGHSLSVLAEPDHRHAWNPVHYPCLLFTILVVRKHRQGSRKDCLMLRA